MALRLAVMVGLLFGLGACTRPEMDQSKVSISLPSKSSSTKVDAQSSEILSHVVINVTGSGMNPFVFNWDRKENINQPSEFVFDFQQGSGRLVQVLAVYEDVTNKSMSFYYGDTTSDFNTSTVTLFIQVARVGGGYNASGRVSGRYQTAANSGPTGPVNITYAVNGKPAMIIERSYIYNGWFHLFGLSDVDLTYSTNDGQVLFGGPVRLNSSTLFPPSQNIVRMQVPLHQRQRDSVYTLSEPQYLIWGWFGFDASSKKVCKEPPSSLSYFKKFDGVSTSLTLSQQSMRANTSDLFSTAGGGLATTATALYDGGASSCSGTEYQDYLSLPEIVFQKPSDGGSLVYGPLRLINTTDGGPFTATGSVWMGQLLPGAEQAIDQVRGYVIPDSMMTNFQNVDSGAFPCGALSGFGGFVQTGVVNSAAFNLDFSPFAAAFSGGNSPNVAICFAKSGQNLPLGFLKRGYLSGGGGGGGGGSVPTQMLVQKAEAPRQGIGNMACTEFVVRLYDANNNETSYSLPLAFTINVSDDNGARPIYQDQMECSNSNAMASTVSFPANQREFRFSTKSNYFMTVSGQSLTVSLSAISPLSLSAPNLNLPVKDYMTKTFKLLLPDYLVPGLCYGAKVQRVEYSGYPSSVAADTSVGFATTGGFAVYSNASCSTSISSATILNGDSFAQVWIKFPVGSQQAGITMSLSSGEATESANQMFKAGGGDGTIASLFVHGPNQISRDMCSSSSFRVVAVNSQGTPIPASSNQTISLVYTGGGLSGSFHGESGCGNAAPSILSAGQFYFEFFPNPTFSGTGNINVTVGSVSQTSPITVTGLHNLDLVVIDATPVQNGACVQVQVAPKNLDNTPGQFSVPASINLTGGFFSGRVSNACVDPISSFQFPAYDSNPKTVYVQVLNNSVSSGTHSISAGASGVLSGNAGIPVNAALALNLSNGSSQNVAEEYVFDVKKALMSFSGITPFTFAVSSGSGSVNSSNGLYSPVAGQTGTISIIDAVSANHSVSATAVAKTFTKDFLTDQTLGTFSLARASTASYVDAAGYLSFASANSPRFDRNSDPASSYAPKGLLIEGQSQNEILYSESITSGPWNAMSLVAVTLDSPVISPSNQTSVIYRVSDTNQDAYNIGRTSQQFTNDLWNDEDYVASVFVKQPSSGAQYAALYFGENTFSCTGVVIDFSNGNGTGLNGPWGCNTPEKNWGIQKFRDGWYRIWARLHSHPTHVGNGSNGGQGFVFLIPAFRTNGTGLTGDGEIMATGDTYFWGMQVERGSSMTSYIQTISAVTTRNADIVTDTLSNIAGFVPAYGTFRVEADVADRAGGLGGTVLELCGASCPSNALNMTIVNSQLARVSATFNGSSIAPSYIFSPGVYNAGGSNIFGVSYKQESFGVNGAVSGHGFSTGVTAIATTPDFSAGTLRLGNNSLNNSPAQMHLKKIEYWPYKISAPGMASW